MKILIIPALLASFQFSLAQTENINSPKRVQATSTADAVKSLSQTRIGSGVFQVNGVAKPATVFIDALTEALKSHDIKVDKVDNYEKPTLGIEVTTVRQNGLYSINIVLTLHEQLIAKRDDKELVLYGVSWRKNVTILAQEDNLVSAVTDSIKRLAKRYSEDFKKK